MATTQQFGIPEPLTVGRTPIAGPGQPADTDQLTRVTAGKMADAMRRAVVDPVLLSAVRVAIQVAGADWADRPAVIVAVWDYVRAAVRFVQDDDVLRATLGMSDELELLIEPPVLLRMAQPAGDCDDFTMLTGAMLLAAGIQWVEVVTIAADGADPRRYSHVYLQVADPGANDAGVTVLDCSHGAYPGWEAPQYYRRTTWGRITAPAVAVHEHHERTKQQGAKMHGLTARPGMYAAGGGLAGMGMGDFDWGTLAGQITTGTFDVIKQVTQKPGQFTQQPGSTISYQVPGAQPAPGGGVVFGGGGSGFPSLTVGGGTGLSGNSMLLIGGALVVALLFATGGDHHR